MSFAGKTKNLFSILHAITIPVIIYLYFFNWRTTAIYGDDTYIYMSQLRLNRLGDIINMDVSFEKYRPIHGLITNLLFSLFEKNVTCYYLFNIGVQTINTFIFAGILNIFLKSSHLSLLISLIIGLSRFALFNITQLFNGGALEGLAMTFFLLSLFFLVRALIKSELTLKQKQQEITLSIVMANLSVYTHERYIVTLFFIALAVIFSPHLQILSRKKRSALSLIAVASMFLNFVIKKYVFGLPFFVGTGGTNISFSFSTTISYFLDAVLSILNINSGPDYLVGASFESIPLLNKISVLLLATTIVLLFIFYIFKIRRTLSSKEKKYNSHTSLLILLLILGGLLLVPAVVGIRLEQRWLQASFSVFILMIAVAFSNLTFQTSHTSKWLLAIFVILFLVNDSYYLFRGGKYIYMIYSEKVAANFAKAIKAGIIRQNTDRLYIWEKQKNDNNENAIRWDLGDGAIFELYQNKSKKIIFVDSVYNSKYPFAFSSFPNFDKRTDQIVYLAEDIVDITNDYLNDSLKYFTTQKINELESRNAIQYDSKELLISNDNFNKFTINGFYENENGMRWTNGNASIAFLGEYVATDSINLELNTYMPSVCKNIFPRLSVVDKANIEHQPLVSRREGDTFIYKLYFDKLITIKKINISSDTIPPFLPDKRIHSFPFVSLKIRN